MIEFDRILEPGGRSRVRVTRESPSVYLDTCALRAIADNLTIRDRFVQALKANSGTLLLSCLSVGELCGQFEKMLMPLA